MNAPPHSQGVRLPRSYQWPEEPLDLSVGDGGGFYPAVLGHQLNATYTIVRKLGWGQHSSVWLARHEGASVLPYVAIKILTAHATEVQGRLSNELHLLQLVKDTAKTSTNPGRDHILSLLDSFEVSSTQGQHLCLVQEPMGLFPNDRSQRKLPLPLVKVVATQLLQGLDFLHSECQVIHTDIKPDNILIKFDSTAIDVESQEKDLEASSVAPTGAAPDPSHAILSRPLYAYSSSDLLSLIQAGSKLNIKLNDFGTAVAAKGFHPELIQPIALRSPEVIPGCGWDKSVDVWNLGCLIFEFLTGNNLFTPRSDPNWAAETYHLAHMPAIAGEKFDLTYFRTGKHFGTCFDDEGLRLKVHGTCGLEAALKNYEVISNDEMPLCLSFLGLMLRLKAEDRASPKELLQHQWLEL